MLATGVTGARRKRDELGSSTCVRSGRVGGHGLPGSARVSRVGDDVSSSRTFLILFSDCLILVVRKDRFGGTPKPDTRDARATRQPPLPNSRGNLLATGSEAR